MITVPKGHIGLQGGGSACAFTAGVLYSLIDDDRFIFSKCTGTSGGALCGSALTQAINKYGYTKEGREIAQKRLVDLWSNIAQPDQAAAMGRLVDSMVRRNPFLHAHFKGQYSMSMEHHLDTTTINPNALQASHPLELEVNAVGDDGEQYLFKGKTLTTQALKASGALPSHFRSVRINGTNMWDGALLGGSNPPIQPLLIGTPDYLLFIMTNPPQSPIKLQQQSELTKAGVKDTDNLVLHQAYNEIALLLKQREQGHDIPPIHVIYPDIESPWTSSDKQDIGQSTINKRFKMGIHAGNDFKQAHRNTLATKSSMTLEKLKSLAKTHHRTPVAA